MTGKRIIKMLVAVAMLISLALPAFAIPARAAAGITILVNNQKIYPDVPPFVLNGRTLVPMRAIAEAMGCEVYWVQETNVVNIKNETTIVSMQIGNFTQSVQKINGDGEVTTNKMDVAPMTYQDRVFIPARALCEALGALVGWDAGSQTIYIVYNTSVDYVSGLTVSTFAGAGVRGSDDGVAASMDFISPESIDIADDGTIYVADSGLIRKISGGRSSTIELSPSYYTADIIRCYKNDVYILTGEFQNDKGVRYYGFLKLSGGDSSAQGLFITDATYSRIPDFCVAPDGMIYFIQYNAGVDQTYLNRLNPNTLAMDALTDLDGGVTCLTADGSGNIYLGNSVKGSIYRYNVNDNHLRLFAGVDGKTKFVDGPNPFFYEPRKLKYVGGALYVLDYNVIRKITIDSSVMPSDCISMAGKVTADPFPVTVNGIASETMLAPSYLMDFAVSGGGIIMTDPKNAVLRVVK